MNTQPVCLLTMETGSEKHKVAQTVNFVNKAETVLHRYSPLERFQTYSLLFGQQIIILKNKN